MKRNRFLWIGVLFCAGASAELSIVPLQQSRISRDPVAFVEARNGDLLLLSAFLDLDFEQRPLHKMFSHVLREDGQLRRHIELPVAGYTSMVAFADGAAMWQREVQAPASQRERIVAIEAKDNGPSRVIYQVNEEIDWLYLGSSPDADALYVAESLRPYRMRLTKFDRQGRQSWQKTFQGSHASNLTATHDGVALIRGIDIDTPASRRVVTLLSADGEVLWDAPVSIEGGGVGTLLFQRSGLIAVADYTYDAQPRLAQYDITTGRLVRTSFIPPFQMERALETVYDRVAALDPEALLSIRREGYCAGAMLLLHRNEFGGSLNGMMPLDAAGETFLHAIDAARQERARAAAIRRK